MEAYECWIDVDDVAAQLGVVKDSVYRGIGERGGSIGRAEKSPDGHGE